MTLLSSQELRKIAADMHANSYRISEYADALDGCEVHPSTPAPAPTPQPTPTQAQAITPEELQMIPWKPFKTGGGSWTFSMPKDGNLIVSKLKAELERTGKTLKIGDWDVKFSGTERAFIARFPAKGK